MQMLRHISVPIHIITFSYRPGSPLSSDSTRNWSLARLGTQSVHGCTHVCLLSRLHQCGNVRVARRRQARYPLVHFSPFELSPTGLIFLIFIVNESDSRVLAGIRALYPTKNDPFATAKTQCENQLLIDAIAMLERRHTFKLLVFSGEFYYEIVEDGILPVFKFIANL